jgi:hypothetical protein
MSHVALPAKIGAAAVRRKDTAAAAAVCEDTAAAAGMVGGLQPQHCGRGGAVLQRAVSVRTATHGGGIGAHAVTFSAIMACSTANRVKKLRMHARACSVSTHAAAVASVVCGARPTTTSAPVAGRQHCWHPRKMRCDM